MKYDYDSLEALSVVIREGSFDLAAKSLGVTQSAISQRIKALEDAVGALLVVRGRPCAPTEIGRHLTQHVEQVQLLQFDLDQQLNEIGDQSKDQERATVRVGVNNDSLATWFPSAIKTATAELNLIFDIVPDDQEHTEKSLSSGDVVAIVTSSDKKLAGCQIEPLGVMEYIAVASREFYETHFSAGVTRETIKKSVCIAFDRKDNIQDLWMEKSLGKPVEVFNHYVPSYDGYLACCLKGVGWGLIPSIAAKSHIASGKLISLSDNASINVPLYWQSRALKSEMMRRLDQIVRSEARKHMK